MAVPTVVPTVVGGFQKVAEAYLFSARTSIFAKTVGLRKDYRAQSRGLLRALELMLGLDEALRLIERTYEDGNYYSLSIEKLLYEFWELDRP